MIALEDICKKLKAQGEFPMASTDAPGFRHWERGFDGYFEGRPRAQFEGKHQLQGWDAGAALSHLKDCEPAVAC